MSRACCLAFLLCAASGLHAQSVMTHSTDNMSIVPGSVACAVQPPAPFATVDNSYWRSYTLSAFGIGATIDVAAIRFGIEEAFEGMGAGMQPAEIFLYTDSTPPAPSPTAGLTQIHSESFMILDQVQSILVQPLVRPGQIPVGCMVTGPLGTVAGPVSLSVDAMFNPGTPITVAPAETLVVELRMPDGTPTTSTFFIGSNGLGQSGPSYLSSTGCGVAQPTDIATLGFPTMHMILDVVHSPFAGPPASDVNITLEWAPAGSGTFNPCTMTGASANPNPSLAVTPGLFGFEWDAPGDGAGGVGPEMVDLRVTVIENGGGTMGTCMITFTVDNTAGCGTICGDCSQNGSGPDILDALVGAQIGAGLVTPTGQQPFCCDVDSNGAVTIIDALLMAQDSAGLPVTPNCP